MLLRWLFGENTQRAPRASDELLAVVRQAMPEADAHDAVMVTALAGLLATVAHADRTYTESERAAVRAALGNVHGLLPQAVPAIEQLLAERLVELAHEPLQTYTRVLYESMEREARVEVFELSMDLAAADDLLDMHETNLLRRIARGLGLSDAEYDASQDRHRQRLSVLK